MAIIFINILQRRETLRRNLIEMGHITLFKFKRGIFYFEASTNMLLKRLYKCQVDEKKKEGILDSQRYSDSEPLHASLTFGKSKFNLKSDRVNLVAPASPIKCLLYLPNVRAIQ